MTSYIRLILYLLMIGWNTTMAQDEEEVDWFEVVYDSPLTIDIDAEEEVEIKAEFKKRVKKNVFYGIKTRKGWTNRINNGRREVELFYKLKTFEEPNKYVRDIYWYDSRRRKIMRTTYAKIDRKYAELLHGPYKKTLDTEDGTITLQEGIFYKGTKHGRWAEWSRKDILIGKEKYYKGWPKLSKVLYYDKERTKLRELIPIHYGEKEGNYFYFHKNGSVAVKGEYRFNTKVGIWTEYYDKRNRKKRQIQYGKDPFDDDFTPYVMREWSALGKEVYKRTKN